MKAEDIDAMLALIPKVRHAVAYSYEAGAIPEDTEPDAAAFMEPDGGLLRVLNIADEALHELRDALAEVERLRGFWHRDSDRADWLDAQVTAIAVERDAAEAKVRDLTAEVERLRDVNTEHRRRDESQDRIRERLTTRADAAEAKVRAVLADVRAVPGQRWDETGHWLLAEDVFSAIEGATP